MAPHAWLRDQEGAFGRGNTNYTQRVGSSSDNSCADIARHERANVT